jgi:chromosome segregation ATPase
MCASKLIGCAGLAVALFFASPVVEAAKKADPAREQMRCMQQMNRKLEQEKSRLSGEKTEIEEKLKSAEGKLDETARESGRRAKALEALRAEKDQLAERLGQTEKQLADTAERLRQEESARQKQEALAAQRLTSIEQCSALNEKLHGEGVRVLEKYRDKGCFDAALQHEPFTGLKQVEVENFVEDQHEKLDELKFDARAAR